MLTCGAASNIVKSLCKCSSNSRIAATLPHLKYTKYLNTKTRLCQLTQILMGRDNFQICEQFPRLTGSSSLEQTKQSEPSRWSATCSLPSLVDVLDKWGRHHWPDWTAPQRRFRTSSQHPEDSHPSLVCLDEKVTTFQVHNRRTFVLKWMCRKKCCWVTFWIGPQQVAHGTVVGHFLFSVDGADLVKSLDWRRKSTVHTEYLKTQNVYCCRWTDLSSKNFKCFCQELECCTQFTLTFPSMMADKLR